MRWVMCSWLLCVAHFAWAGNIDLTHYADCRANCRYWISPTSQGTGDCESNANSCTFDAWKLKDHSNLPEYVCVKDGVFTSQWSLEQSDGPITGTGENSRIHFCALQERTDSWNVQTGATSALRIGGDTNFLSFHGLNFTSNAADNEEMNIIVSRSDNVAGGSCHFTSHPKASIGFASSGSATSIQVPGDPWTPGALVGYRIYNQAEQGGNCSAVFASNTANSATFEAPLGSDKGLTCSGNGQFDAGEGFYLLEIECMPENIVFHRVVSFSGGNLAATGGGALNFQGGRFHRVRHSAFRGSGRKRIHNFETDKVLYIENFVDCTGSLTSAHQICVSMGYHSRRTTFINNIIFVSKEDITTHPVNQGERIFTDDRFEYNYPSPNFDDRWASGAVTVGIEGSTFSISETAFRIYGGMTFTSNEIYTRSDGPNSSIFYSIASVGSGNFQTPVTTGCSTGTAIDGYVSYTETTLPTHVRDLKPSFLWNTLCSTTGPNLTTVNNLRQYSSSGALDFSPSVGGSNNFAFTTLASDPTGPYLGTTAICKKRDDSGALTTEGLWPWGGPGLSGLPSMDQRVLGLRTLIGKTPRDVTSTVEAEFGAIPSECLREAGTAPPSVLTGGTLVDSILR